MKHIGGEVEDAESRRRRVPDEKPAPGTVPEKALVARRVGAASCSVPAETLESVGVCAAPGVGPRGAELGGGEKCHRLHGGNVERRELT